jgi:2-methylcitrate dehydratase PrpD
MKTEAQVVSRPAISSRIARFVASTQDIPAAAAHQGVRCLIDWIGNACAGAGEPGSQILHDLVEELGTKAEATVVGTATRVSAADAALLNGYHAHVLDFDDTHTPTVLHPTSPVMSAAAAMAESRGAPGRDLILAYAVGAEVAIHIAGLVCPSHYERGWHVTGTAGAIGAAAAAARLLGTSEAQIQHAIGIAATQPTGLRVQFGTMTKALHSAAAASNGLRAALLAARGFTASPQSLEGPNGFIQATSQAREPAPALPLPGGDYRLCDVSFKPYPCGVVTHALIDAVIRLRNEHRLAPASVRAIHARLGRSEPLPQLAANPEPASGMAGKFSLAHCAAVALADGAAGVKQFSDERVVDPVIRDLRKVFTATLDGTVRATEAYVSIELDDGRVVETHVAAHTGTPENPMTDEDLERKFRTLSAPRFPGSRIDAIVNAARNVTRATDFGSLMRLCSTG